MCRLYWCRKSDKLSLWRADICKLGNMECAFFPRIFWYLSIRLQDHNSECFPFYVLRQTWDYFKKWCLSRKQHSKFMFLAFLVHKVIWKYMLMWQKEVEQITLWYSPMRSSFWTVVELSLLSLAILKYNWRQQHAVECWRTCSHTALSQKSRRTLCFFRDYRSICLLVVLIWWR